MNSVEVLELCARKQEPRLDVKGNSQRMKLIVNKVLLLRVGPKINLPQESKNGGRLSALPVWSSVLGPVMSFQQD